MRRPGSGCCLGSRSKEEAEKVRFEGAGSPEFRAIRWLQKECRLRETNYGRNC